MKSRHQHIIDAGHAKFGQCAPRRLAQTPLGPVADHGAADLFAGGYAKSNDAPHGAPPGFNHYIRPPRARAIAHEQELRAFGQALQDDFQSGRRQAESRLRPLARRRDSTFWPPLVAMRARKPWRRARTSRLGWKVRLVLTTGLDARIRKARGLPQGGKGVKISDAGAAAVGWA